MLAVRLDPVLEEKFARYCKRLGLSRTAAELEHFITMIGKYRDHAIDFADASLVWLAATCGLCAVLTTDRKDFERYRLPGNNTLTFSNQQHVTTTFDCEPARYAFTAREPRKCFDGRGSICEQAWVSAANSQQRLYTLIHQSAAATRAFAGRGARREKSRRRPRCRLR